MNKNHFWKMTTAGLALALGVVLTTGATSGTEERQPLMRKALGNLNGALSNLQNATADKGGHRVAAISLVKQAIAEVEKGIAADNAN